ncbi:MAG: ferredoxin [Bacilli bacterium]|nr:ferredoxin [Bacilli bacterium]
MKVKINEDNCIGCGYCEGVCDEVFEVVDGVSTVKVQEVPAAAKDNVIDAIENCPTSAIEEIKD